MRINNKKYGSLAYLAAKPKIINWKVISPVGVRLSSLQDHDVVFDDYDLKIRKLT